MKKDKQNKTKPRVNKRTDGRTTADACAMTVGLSSRANTVSGDMVNSYLSTKFGINSLDGF